MAIDEELMRESQAELIINAMAMRVKGGDDTMERDESYEFVKTVGD